MKFASQGGPLPVSADLLLLVDVINSFRFPGGETLAQEALPVARRIAALKKRLRAEGVPAIYANDNEGQWQADFGALLARCERLGGAAAEFARRLPPRRGDLPLLKPRHSAFLGTPLDLMLKHMRVRRIVLVGLATDLCVQFTAMDAYLRGFRLWVPADCTAAQQPRHKAEALAYMRRVLKADVRPAAP